MHAAKISIPSLLYKFWNWFGSLINSYRLQINKQPPSFDSTRSIRLLYSDIHTKMVSSLVGEILSAVPSSSSSESLEEQHPPKAQVFDASYHRIRNGSSFPPNEENHNILFRTHPHTAYAPPAQHFNLVERSVSSVPSPPPVTPSPSSPTQTSYRFETPAYVFAPATSSVLEQLKSSAGCTCKKSRYVFCIWINFIVWLHVF